MGNLRKSIFLLISMLLLLSISCDVTGALSLRNATDQPASVRYRAKSNQVDYVRELIIDVRYPQTAGGGYAGAVNAATTSSSNNKLEQPQ